jgi:hypothetical protein
MNDREKLRMYKMGSKERRALLQETQKKGGKIHKKV